VVRAGAVVTKDVPPNTFMRAILHGSSTLRGVLGEVPFEKHRNIPRKELKAVLTNMFERELDQHIKLPDEPVLETHEPTH